MGIESTFACNMLKEVELEKNRRKSVQNRFGSPMMYGVSHAQRPPRQRLRSSRLLFTNAVDPLGRKTGKCPSWRLRGQVVCYLLLMSDSAIMRQLR
jgi:uncharacterized protein YjiS (DUF1127 family)